MDPTLYDAAIRSAGPSWLDGSVVGFLAFLLALTVFCWPSDHTGIVRRGRGRGEAGR